MHFFHVHPQFVGWTQRLARVAVVWQSPWSSETKTHIWIHGPWLRVSSRSSSHPMRDAMYDAGYDAMYDAIYNAGYDAIYNADAEAAHEAARARDALA